MNKKLLIPVLIIGALALFVLQPAANRFLSVNRCLNDGGSWDQSSHECEFVNYEEVVQVEESLDLVWIPNTVDGEIRNLNLSPGDEVSTPLSIEGEARGFWFFEAVMPVEVVDQDGNSLGQGFVTAINEWMTENFVSFAGIVEFQVPAGVEKGFVVLSKDNPSGEPQFDASLSIPVLFN